MEGTSRHGARGTESKLSSRASRNQEGLPGGGQNGSEDGAARTVPESGFRGRGGGGEEGEGVVAIVHCSWGVLALRVRLHAPVEVRPT